MVSTITKDRLVDLATASHVRLIDVRPAAAYHGWRLHDEPRGGHIPGAVSLPASWEVDRDGPLQELLDGSHITREHHIVVYGDEWNDPTRLGARLVALGYREVATYRGGFGEWAADDRLEVARLPRYQHLVHGEWLEDLLAGRPVEAAPAGEFALFHATFAGPDEYRAGHLPGAFELDTNELESPADHNRRSPEELESYLLDRGITADTCVIVYGRDDVVDIGGKRSLRPAGHIAATRAASILLYAGVGDVRVLDGGYGAWLAAGGDVETTGRNPRAATEFGADIPLRPDLFIDLDEARALLADPDGVLVSIRSWAEHVGVTSGYDYIGQRGDIPGAVWAGGGADAHDMSQYRSPDNTTLAPGLIAERWRNLGITPERRVAFYCGTGWRASEAFFDAHLMGWTRLAVYDGGWFEWSRRTRVPE
jgi:thiosulfate/3-mercaptopyruvate sulfurtransferase